MKIVATAIFIGPVEMENDRLRRELEKNFTSKKYRDLLIFGEFGKGRDRVLTGQNIARTENGRRPDGSCNSKNSSLSRALAATSWTVGNKFLFIFG